MSEKVWVTGDGRVLRLSAMATPHLNNVITHVQRQAQVAAILVAIDIEAAGFALPDRFTWKDFLPRHYEDLLAEADRRRRDSLLNDMAQIPEDWLRNWIDPEILATVIAWQARHRRPQQG